MGTFTESGKNQMLDALSIDQISLHSADPGATGTNELAAGTAGYARKVPTLNAASGGARSLNAALAFDVSGGDAVSYVGFWQAGTFKGSDIVTTENFGADGVYNLTASSLTI